MDTGNNQRLIQWQNEYLATGDQNAWASLWMLSIEICRNIIQGETKRKGYSMTREDKEDKARDAALYVLRRYKTRPGYRIDKNFISALKFGVKHSLYYVTDKTRAMENAASLDAMDAENWYTEDIADTLFSDNSSCEIPFIFI